MSWSLLVVAVAILADVFVVFRVSLQASSFSPHAVLFTPNVKLPLLLPLATEKIMP
jgi:hypothetical protein